MSVTTPARLTVLILLLLLIFTTRMVNLTAFPVFIDETIHIEATTRFIEVSPLYGMNIGRQLTLWLYWLFQPVQSNPVWVARAATVLISMTGISALLSIATKTTGIYGTIITGLFILFSPYHYFFERLALADGVATGFILMAIAMGYRLRYRLHGRDALLCGGLLALGILAKINVIPYAGVILAAPVAFMNRYTKSALLRWFCIALGAVSLPIIALEVLVRVTGNVWLIAIINYVDVDTSSSGAVTNLIDHILLTGQWLNQYFHPVMAITLLIGSIALLIQKRWYLFLVTFAPMLPMWITDPQQSRYWLPVVALLGLATATTITHSLKNASRPIRLLPVIALIGWGLTLWLPFMMTILTNPVAVPLPDSERGQYVRADGIGFGFDALVELIPAGDMPQVAGILANCNGLKYTHYDRYEVLCRPINPDGSDIPELIAWVESLSGQNVYAVLEESPFLPQTIPGTLLATLEHESGRPALSVYALDN